MLSTDLNDNDENNANAIISLTFETVPNANSFDFLPTNKQTNKNASQRYKCHYWSVPKIN